MSCLKNPKMYINNLRQAITQLNIFDNLPDAKSRSQKAESVIWAIEQDVIGNIGKYYFLFF